MSFFSGFILGQAANGRGNSGGVTMGFFAIFVFTALVIAVIATVGAFLLPLYSIVHLTMWAAETELLSGIASVIIPIVLVVSVPLAYAQALFGQKHPGIGGMIVLGILAAMSVAVLPYFDGSLLHRYLDDPAEITQNAIIAGALCVGCSAGLRLMIAAFMSTDRRSRIIDGFMRPYLSAYQSSAFAWTLCIVALLALIFCCLMIWDGYQRVYTFMDTYDRTYEDAFDFIFWGDRFTEYMNALVFFVVLNVVTAAHLILHRRRVKRSGAATLQ